MSIRYGFVGCGNISKFHFSALDKIGAKVTWVADINLEAAKTFAAQRDARVTADYNELIAAEDVDVVCILASAAVHKDVAMKAIAAGKHVICEKTMTTCQNDARQVLETAEASGKMFFMSYMKRFYSAAKKTEALLPEIGKVFSAYARSYQAWGDFFTEDAHGWDLDAVLKTYGGAVTKCAGSHMLDMVMWLLGKPEHVYASINYYPQTDFDRMATALLEYDDNKTVTFETLAHPLRRIGYERNSWDEYIEINGVGGRITLYTTMWDHPDNNGALLVHYDNASESQTEYRFAPENPFDLEIAYFHECMRSGLSGRPNARDGYNVDVLIERMFQSSNENRRVTIDWGTPP